MSDGFWVAVGCGVAVAAASIVWSAWTYDRATRIHAQQAGVAQAQLEQSAEQQRVAQVKLEQSAEQQRRSAALLDRQEALLAAVEALVRRVESRL